MLGFLNFLKFLVYLVLIILRWPFFLILGWAKIFFTAGIMIFIFIYFFIDKSMKSIEFIFGFGGILIGINILAYYYDKLIFWCSPKDDYDDC